MASNLDTLVTVFGGSGFLGRQRGPRARQARLPHPGRGAAAGTGRASAAARQGRPDPRRAGQSALPGFGRGRDARSPCRDQSGRHSRRKRRADLRRGAGRRRRDGGQGGSRRRRADGACLGHRRRREFALALRRAKAAGEKAVLAAHPVGHHPAAFDRVRAGGPIHQPLRGVGADIAGAAADRRRPRPDCSRSMSAMSRPRSPTPSTARPSRARFTSSAARKC